MIKPFRVCIQKIENIPCVNIALSFLGVNPYFADSLFKTYL